MADYKNLYTHLFNAVTDAVEAMERQDFGTAKSRLILAQQETEEMFLNMDDEA